MSLITKEHLDMVIKAISNLKNNFEEKLQTKFNKDGHEPNKVLHTDESGNIVLKDEVQSDWNQNDKNAPDYIKNRICYSEITPENDLIPEIKLNLTTVNCIIPAYGKTIKPNVNYDIYIDGEVFHGRSNDKCKILYDITGKDFDYHGQIQLFDDVFNVWIGVCPPNPYYKENEIITYRVVEKLPDTTDFPIDKKYIPSKYLVGKVDTHFGEVFNDYFINKATGRYSHAEGYHCYATGDNSHAEGDETAASGSDSHVEGFATVASGRFSHVEGRCNIPDTDDGTAKGTSLDKYLHIVGNGAPWTKNSNAYTLDWDGNGWYQNDVLVGGKNADDPEAVSLKKVAESVPTKPEDIGAQPKGEYALKSDVPNVPDWAKEENKPKYTAEEIGAEKVGSVSAHNTAVDAHNDIRLLITNLTSKVNAFLDSDDKTFDQLTEIVAYIKSNRNLIDSITTSKVNVSDVIDNLTTNIKNKPLSAAQGVELKRLIDAIVVPEIPEWALKPEKPVYSAKDVGALSVSGGEVSGNIDMKNNSIKNINDPVNDTDAVNKKYVDENSSKPEISVQNEKPLEDNISLWIDPDAPDLVDDLGITNAKVGDLLSVKSVDKNGVPTEWENVKFDELGSKFETIEVINCSNDVIFRDKYFLKAIVLVVKCKDVKTGSIPVDIDFQHRNLYASIDYEKNSTSYFLLAPFFGKCMTMTSSPIENQWLSPIIRGPTPYSLLHDSWGIVTGIRTRREIEEGITVHVIGIRA